MEKKNQTQSTQLVQFGFFSLVTICMVLMVATIFLAITEDSPTRAEDRNDFIVTIQPTKTAIPTKTPEGTSQVTQAAPFTE